MVSNYNQEKPAVGQTFIVERKQRISIEGRGSVYIKNTQTQVRELYRRNPSSEPVPRSSSLSDTKILKTSLQVEALNRKIEDEIGKLKNFRDCFLNNEEAKANKARNAQRSTNTKQLAIDQGQSTKKEAPRGNSFSSPDAKVAGPYFRTVSVAAAPKSRQPTNVAAAPKSRPPTNVAAMENPPVAATKKTPVVASEKPHVRSSHHERNDRMAIKKPPVAAKENPTVAATEKPHVRASYHERNERMALKKPPVAAVENPPVAGTEKPHVRSSHQERNERMAIKKPPLASMENPPVAATKTPRVTATEKPHVRSSHHERNERMAIKEPPVAAMENPPVAATKKPTVAATEKSHVRASHHERNERLALKKPPVAAVENPPVAATKTPRVAATEKPPVRSSHHETNERMGGGCSFGCNNERLPPSVYQRDFVQNPPVPCRCLTCGGAPHCHQSYTHLCCHNACRCIELPPSGPYSPNPCYQYQPHVCIQELHHCQPSYCTFPRPTCSRRVTDLNTANFCRDWIPSQNPLPNRSPSPTRQDKDKKDKGKVKPKYPTLNQKPENEDKIITVSQRKQQPTKLDITRSSKVKPADKKEDNKRSGAVKKSDHKYNAAEEKLRLHQEYMEMYRRENERSAEKDSSKGASDLVEHPTYTKIPTKNEPEDDQPEMSVSYVKQADSDKKPDKTTAAVKSLPQEEAPAVKPTPSENVVSSLKQDPSEAARAVPLKDSHQSQKHVMRDNEFTSTEIGMEDTNKQSTVPKKSKDAACQRSEECVKYKTCATCQHTKVIETDPNGLLNLIPTLHLGRGPSMCNKASQTSPVVLSTADLKISSVQSQTLKLRKEVLTQTNPSDLDIPLPPPKAPVSPKPANRTITANQATEVAWQNYVQRPPPRQSKPKLDEPIPSVSKAAFKASENTSVPENIEREKYIPQPQQLSQPAFKNEIPNDVQIDSGYNNNSGTGAQPLPSRSIPLPDKGNKASSSALERPSVDNSQMFYTDAESGSTEFISFADYTPGKSAPGFYGYSQSGTTLITNEGNNNNLHRLEPTASRNIVQDSGALSVQLMKQELYEDYKPQHEELNERELMPTQSITCLQRTRLVKFEDESGKKAQSQTIKLCRKTVDWERAHKIKDKPKQSLETVEECEGEIEEPVKPNPSSDDSEKLESPVSSSTADTEFTCEDNEDNDVYLTCNESRTDHEVVNLPPFNGCPCLYNEYLKLAALCTPLKKFNYNAYKH